MIPNWTPRAPKWSKEESKLLSSPSSSSPSITLEEFCTKSENLPLKFPIDTNRCKTLKDTISKETLERNINSAYPIIHESILLFYAKYLIHKRTHGNSIEKEIYQNMNISQFINRLLTKRAVSFIGKHDTFLLISGKKGSSKWETIGTLLEKYPTTLKECLSYEEVKLSAFLSVSSYSYFINVGDRKNFALPEENRTKIQDEGIIVGIIGPRLVKTGVMDYHELVITETQNTQSNGYGEVSPPTIHHLFADLYEEECLEYGEIIEKKNHLPKDIQRYTTLRSGEILDNFIYFKRVLFTMDLLFLEANQRAQEKNTTAYIHVVGIGLGVWKKSECQNKIFMDTCAQRIKFLGKHLYNVSDIRFAYIKHDSCGPYKNGQTIPIEGHPQKGIKIHICKKEPHEKLTGIDSEKLLVVSYAWDGNAWPGNEYWNKKLGSSGDSASASSTQISEIHNPFINPKVNADNLKVVTLSGKVLSFQHFQEVHNTLKRPHS